MNKILRYSFMMLLAFICGSINAATITFSELGLENGVQYTDPFDGDDFTVTFAGGANDGKYYNTGAAIRVYGNGTMTVAAKSGKLTQIVITYDGTNKPESSDVVNVGSYNAETGTWTGDAASVVFTRPSGSGHWRIKSVTATVGGAVDTRKATTIEFADGYKTKIAGGPDNMFPQVGTFVTLPQATVMAGEDAVAGAEVAWSLEVKKWKESKPQPTIEDGKIVVGDGVNGEITVKASYEGNTSYLGSTKTYTLKVYNSYGLLSEMVNDIADPEFAKNDENDGDGQQVFYFFRNIDAEGFPVVKNTVTYVNGKYIYLTDGEKNLLFYGTNSQELKAGNVISGNVNETNLGGFWGNLKRFNKLPEFAFTEMNVKVEEEGTAPAPKVITVDALKDNINAYVQIKNAVFVEANEKNLTFTVGEQTLAIYNQFTVDVAALEAGKTYDLTGTVCVRKKNNEDAIYQLYLTAFEEAANPYPELPELPTVEQQPILKFTANGQWASYTFNKADFYAKDYKGFRIEYSNMNTVESGSAFNILINSKETHLGKDWKGDDAQVPNMTCYKNVGFDAAHNVFEGNFAEFVLTDDPNTTCQTITQFALQACDKNHTVIIKKVVFIKNDDTEVLPEYKGDDWGGTAYTIEDLTDGINNVNAAKAENGVMYNLAGQKVNNGYKGVVIMNGKKMLNK
jgi:hypothetical protein